jgi:hypothetical protein
MGLLNWKVLLLSIAVVFGVVIYNSVSIPSNQMDPDVNFLHRRISADDRYYQVRFLFYLMLSICSYAFQGHTNAL